VGLLSWLFPNDDDRLASAKASMAAGKYEAARKTLMHCKAPEAEALYDECDREIDKAARAGVKKSLAKQGFHGWKIEIGAKGERRKQELEAQVKKELANAGVDLDLPNLDQDLVKAVLAKVERTLKSNATIKIVPVLDEKAQAKAKASSKAG
jgi:hypothetical protein